ncbi:MAG TPA: DUF1465 family protein [Hyphomicrobiaceae bacterium]|nr:DUF1465 family protein [Hyphomicrobiaceae bacterium]
MTVSFAERFASSDQFEQLFKDGMGLVEATASYLDGQGRRDARQLTPGIALIYATESMRLTTRLLEIASWLLLRRALRDGEINESEARVRRRTIRLGTIGRPSHVTGWAELPPELRRLVDASFAVNDRIVQVDKVLNGSASIEPTADQNPVAHRIAAIEQAFGDQKVTIRKVSGGQRG